ncbi:MAG: hypothetical protein EU547_03690 [Promethearchaeota archaeon]|nr:MAG: hypothetical protein EU547_03690 [Candidatus Lokiarchaeota archaeon]
MGFFTSILLISLFGFFSHYFYKKYGILNGKLGWIFYYSIIVNGGFLIVDLLTYFGLFNSLFPIINRLPWISIENGKDLMWNSFLLFSIDWNIKVNQQGLNYIAFLLFFSYPIWFKFFKDLSRKFFGGNKRKPYEKGISFLISSRIDTEFERDKKKIKAPRKV